MYIGRNKILYSLFVYFLVKYNYKFQTIVNLWDKWME